MRLIATTALSLLLASCTRGPDGAGTSLSASPAQTPTSSAAQRLPDEALPVPTPSPWTTRAGTGLDRPDSSEAEIGEPGSFELYTHCGWDFRVDFDGSFWQSYADPRERPTDPSQKGSMTLLTEQVAVFRFETARGENSIYFVRNDSPKNEGACY